MIFQYMPTKMLALLTGHRFHHFIGLNACQSEDVQNMNLAPKTGIRGIEYLKNVAFIKTKCA